MKKLFTVLTIILFLVGCSSEKTYEFDKNTILDSFEMEQAFSNSKDNKGKSVEFSGRIFNEIQQDDGFIYYQIFRDFEKSDKSTAIRVKKELAGDISIDSFVLVNGVILGEMQAKNAFNADISSPIIDVNEIVVGTFDQTVAVANKTININKEESQNGHSVSLERIEFSDYDTRLFLTVKNDSNDKVSLYPFNASLVVNGRNYKEEYNYYIDYPEIDSELQPGTESKGVISFPKMDSNNLGTIKVIFERPYSSNWETDFNDYVFEISIN